MLMLQSGEKKVLTDPQNAPHQVCGRNRNTGHSRALEQCQFSRDFILTPLFFLVELLWAQTAGFHIDLI